MKKTLIFLFLIVSFGVQAQYWSPTIDTVKFRLSRGKLYKLITYPTADSIDINGLRYYTNATPSESDPVWTGDSARYLSIAQADTTYEFKLAAETYMAKSGDDTISGYKTFNEGTLVLFNAASDGVTTLTTLAGHSAGRSIAFPNTSGTVALTSNLYRMTRYSAYSSGGNSVEVMADSIGVTAALVGSTFTFTIPAGVKVSSIKMRVTGMSNVSIHMGTDDMANSSLADRWMPIVQAWREDTGQQLTGLTTTMDLTYFDKFVINGLISTTNNHIRIDF